MLALAEASFRTPVQKAGNKLRGIIQTRNIETSFINESWFNILAQKKNEIRIGRDAAQPRKLIAVFGGANVDENSNAWRKYFKLGKEIASRKAILMNGGYGGVMKATAAGARSVDGITIGVTCDNLPDRTPNLHIQFEWKVERWDQRMLALIWLADGYAITPGSSGTLVELSMVIETQAKGFIPVRPIVCLGKYWKPVTNRIDNISEMIRFTNSPAKCAEILTG